MPTSFNIIGVDNKSDLSLFNLKIIDKHNKKEVTEKVKYIKNI